MRELVLHLPGWTNAFSRLCTHPEGANLVLLVRNLEMQVVHMPIHELANMICYRIRY